MKKATTTMLPILLAALTAKKGKPPGKPEELESFQGFPPLSGVFSGVIIVVASKGIGHFFLLQESDGSKYVILNFPIASSVALLAQNIRRLNYLGKKGFLFSNVVVDTHGFVQKKLLKALRQGKEEEEVILPFIFRRRGSDLDS